MSLTNILILVSIVTYPIPSIRIMGQPIAIFLSILSVVTGVISGRYRYIRKEYLYVIMGLFGGYFISSIAAGVFNVSYLLNLCAFFSIFMMLAVKGYYDAYESKCDKKLNEMIKILIISGIILCIYGFYGYITGNIGDQATYYWWETSKYWGIHYTESTRNADIHYIVIPFIAVLSKKQKGIFDKGLLIAFGAAILLSMSRGCWIALLCVLCVFALLELNLNNFLKYSVWGIILIIGSSFVLSYFGMENYFIEKILSIFNSDIASSNAERWKIIKSTLKIIANHPFGVGAERMNLYYDMYGLNVNHAENTYLNIIAEMGIAAALAYCYLVFKPVVKLWGFVKKNKTLTDLEKYVVLSFVYLIITFLFNTETINCYIWIVLGINWYLFNASFRKRIIEETNGDY